MRIAASPRQTVSRQCNARRGPCDRAQIRRRNHLPPGGGIAGIAESKIYFVSERTGHKEIWMMDYDGANQQQITHQGSISLSPRVSPDGSRLAFSSISKAGGRS